MNRSITNKLNYILDNWLPPVIRDNELFMGFVFYMVFGKKYHYYMNFKDRAYLLKEEDINQYYEILADTFINRNTDLNAGCIKYILGHISGTTILDAAAGKGYLVRMLKKQGRGNFDICAVDIVLPKSKLKGVHYQKATLTNLPFESDFFDTVICTHALEHIKDYERALKELRRVCKKRLMIVVPKQKEYKYTFDLHMNFFPYAYHIQKLLNNPKAQILEIGNDWVCVEDYS